MIRVEEITIKEFRGIRDLTLDFGGRNYAVCGPNGTGKSGVVDALEFALTGKVARLSGEGKGDISLKVHGPHVDRRDDPDEARVTLTVTIPSLNRTATIERTPKSPANPKVTPADPAVLAVLRQVEAHPEIVLSRRELIRYVLATPGKRAEEVQGLLRLDKIDQVRVGLQKVANTCEKQLGPHGTSTAHAREKLMRALGVSELAKDKVLALANAQRATIGLPPLPGLDGTTSLREGMIGQQGRQPQRVSKSQALADIQETRQLLSELVSPATTALATDVTSEVAVLANDPQAAAAVARQSFYDAGIALIEPGACPFCDTEWDLGTLVRHVQHKLEHLKEVSQKRKSAEKRIAPLVALLRKARSSIETLAGYAALLVPPVPVKAAIDYSATCAATAATLDGFLPLAETIGALESLPSVPAKVLEVIAALEKTVAALPEPTQQDAARDWLTIAQLLLEAWRDSKRKERGATEQAQLARKVSDVYAVTSTEVLTGIYTDVQGAFASLYASMHRDDEGAFKAKLRNCQ